MDHLDELDQKFIDELKSRNLSEEHYQTVSQHAKFMGHAVWITPILCLIAINAFHMAW